MQQASPLHALEVLEANRMRYHATADVQHGQLTRPSSRHGSSFTPQTITSRALHDHHDRHEAVAETAHTNHPTAALAAAAANALQFLNACSRGSRSPSTKLSVRR